MKSLRDSTIIICSIVRNAGIGLKKDIPIITAYAYLRMLVYRKYGNNNRGVHYEKVDIDTDTHIPFGSVKCPIQIPDNRIN